MTALKSLKHYARGDRHYVQAQRIWLILIGVVMQRSKHAEVATITYGELATLMHYDPRAGRTLARPLGIVGWVCVEHGLPTLNSIVVNAIDREPGGEVVVHEQRSWQQEQVAVMAVDWYALRVPSAATFRDAKPAAPNLTASFELRLPAPPDASQHMRWVTMQIGVAAAVAGLSGAGLDLGEEKVDGGVLALQFDLTPTMAVTDEVYEVFLGHLRARFVDRPSYVVERQ